MKKLLPTVLFCLLLLPQSILVAGLPCPLEIVDADALALGKILSTGQHEFCITIRNDSTETIILQSIRFGCPCLSLRDGANGEIAPGKSHQLKLYLDARKIPMGIFARNIFLECQGYLPLILTISGESVALLSLTPGTSLDFGNFEGQLLNWNRAIHIKTSLPEFTHLFILHRPQESIRFILNLQQLSANTAVLEITPRLPLPTGNFLEEISLPIGPEGKQEKVKLSLLGNVTGIRLTVEPQQLEVLPSNHTTAILQISFDHSRHPGARRRITERRSNRPGVSKENIAADEQQQRNASYWQKLASWLQISAPPQLQAELLPQDNGLQLRVTFAPDYQLLPDHNAILLMLGEKVLLKVPIVAR